MNRYNKYVISGDCELMEDERATAMIAADLDGDRFADSNIIDWVGDSEPDLWLQLGRLAASTLYREDAELHASLSLSASRASYSQCAAGLSYWVYETTLVYLIFKAWAPHKHVVWDWDGPQNATSGRKNPIDLILEVEPGRQIGIEAKWWNSTTKRVELGLDADASKLLSWVATKPAQRTGFLLAFWWTDSERLEKDQSDAASWRQRNQRELVYRASFATHGPPGQLRRFFFDVMKVSVLRSG
jgi:hypothetical protein